MSFVYLLSWCDLWKKNLRKIKIALKLFKTTFKRKSAQRTETEMCLLKIIYLQPQYYDDLANNFSTTDQDSGTVLAINFWIKNSIKNVLIWFQNDGAGVHGSLPCRSFYQVVRPLRAALQQPRIFCSVRLRRSRTGRNAKQCFDLTFNLVQESFFFYF